MLVQQAMLVLLKFALLWLCLCHGYAPCHWYILHRTRSLSQSRSLSGELNLQYCRTISCFMYAYVNVSTCLCIPTLVCIFVYMNIVLCPEVADCVRIAAFMSKYIQS
jgi:hypothetical protein